MKIIFSGHMVVYFNLFHDKLHIFIQRSNDQPIPTILYLIVLPLSMSVAVIEECSVSGNVPAVEILYRSNAVYCWGDQRQLERLTRQG